MLQTKRSAQDLEIHTKIAYFLDWFMTEPRRIITNEIANTIIRSLQAKAIEMQLTIYRIRVLENHVQIELEAPETLAPRQIAINLKTASSTALKEQHPELAKRRGIWELGYIIATSETDWDRIQEEHYADKDTNMHKEPMPIAIVHSNYEDPEKKPSWRA